MCHYVIIPIKTFKKCPEHEICVSLSIYLTSQLLDLFHQTFAIVYLTKGAVTFTVDW